MLRGSATSAWRRGPPAVDAETKTLNWPFIYAVAEAVFDRVRYFFFLDSGRRMQATLRIMSITASIREYAIINVDDIAPAWGALRTDEFLVDLIMSVTADLLMETGVTVDTLARALSVAVHSMVAVSATGEAVTEGVAYDTAFMESLGTAEELYNVLRLNPWMVTLMILRRTGRLNVVRPQVTSPERTTEATP